MNTKKTFDAVEMKDGAHEALQVRIEGMTSAEETAFWAERHAAFLEKRRVIFERQKASAPIPALLPTANSVAFAAGTESKRVKDFDCVEMKDEIQSDIQKKMARMTPEEAVLYCKLRFRMETLFFDQKRRGFHLAHSHLSAANRLERLLTAACLAYVWLV